MEKTKNYLVQYQSVQAAKAVIGSGTRFTTELKIGDSISFINDSGNTETKIIEAIINDNSLTLSDNASNSTKTIVTRQRTKLQDANKNISLFKLPYDNIKTLKTGEIQI